MLVIRHLLDNHNFNRLVVPCAGLFSQMKGAFQAGIKPEQVEASDFSFFTSMLGFLYSGKPLEKLGYEILDPVVEREHDQCEDDFERCAVMMLHLKLRQFKATQFHQRRFINYYLENKEMVLREIVTSLKNNHLIYGGIDYEMADLREILSREYDEQTLVFINPPSYSGGYTVMFPIEDMVRLEYLVEEFDYDSEFPEEYWKSKEKKWTGLWTAFGYKADDSRYTTDTIPAEDFVFAEERPNLHLHTEYMTITKPELLKTFPHKSMVWARQDQFMEKVKQYKTVPIDFVLKETTKISIKFINRESALYYRSLWAHKLGNSNADDFGMICLDNYAFAVYGFNYADMRRFRLGVKDDLHLLFGFNPKINGYPRLNRLVMRIMTCREFKNIILNGPLRTNRLFNVGGVKTTCYSKYRKVKLNSGIFKVYAREKVKEGQAHQNTNIRTGYKISYRTDFNKLDFKEVLKNALDSGELVGPKVHGENDGEKERVISQSA